MKRMEKASRLGRFIGSIGLWVDHAIIYPEILERSVTEAGRVPYLALTGNSGINSIRDGTRKACISLTSTITFIFKASIIKAMNTLAGSLKGGENLLQANEIAHTLGIPTELDLENEIARTYGTGPNVKPDWDLIKSKIRQKYARM